MDYEKKKGQVKKLRRELVELADIKLTYDDLKQELENSKQEIESLEAELEETKKEVIILRDKESSIEKDEDAMLTMQEETKILKKNIELLEEEVKEKIKFQTEAMKAEAEKEEIENELQLLEDNLSKLIELANDVIINEKIPTLSKRTFNYILPLVMRTFAKEGFTEADLDRFNKNIDKLEKQKDWEKIIAERAIEEIEEIEVPTPTAKEAPVEKPVVSPKKPVVSPEKEPVTKPVVKPEITTEPGETYGTFPETEVKTDVKNILIHWATALENCSDWTEYIFIVREYFEQVRDATDSLFISPFNQFFTRTSLVTEETWITERDALLNTIQKRLG